MIQFEPKKIFQRKYHGSRIVLRPIERNDANEIFKLVFQSDLYKFTFIPKRYSLQTTRKWIIKQIEIPQVLLITFPKDDKIIGTIGIVADDFKKRHWEIGYWLGQKYRGRGYMREALNIFLQKVKKHTPIRKVSAKVFVGNNGAIKLLRSVGFIREGLLRNHFYHNSKMKSVVMFGYYVKRTK